MRSYNSGERRTPKLFTTQRTPYYKEQRHSDREIAVAEQRKGFTDSTGDQCAADASASSLALFLFLKAEARRNRGSRHQHSGRQRLQEAPKRKRYQQSVREAAERQAVLLVAFSPVQAPAAWQIGRN